MVHHSGKKDEKVNFEALLFFSITFWLFLNMIYCFYTEATSLIWIIEGMCEERLKSLVLGLEKWCASSCELWHDVLCFGVSA